MRRLLLVVTIVVTLTGCFGGGDEGSGPTFDSAPLSAAELGRLGRLEP